MQTIVLFTAAYPYTDRGEYMFIEPELEVLSNFFKVIIIPMFRLSKKREFINNLKNVYVMNDLPDFRKLIAVKSFDKNLFKELSKSRQLKKVLSHYARVKWIENYIKNQLKRKVFKEDYIYYTFWFNFATTALINLRKEGLKNIITRVHGKDLYLERNNGYIPFRNRDIDNIKYIFPVSSAAKKYLITHYNCINKTKLFYLLQKDYKIINPVNKSQMFKLIGCSFVSPLKRVDLTLHILYEMSKKFNIKVEYTHIGDGVDYEKVKNIALNIQNKNFKINLLGFKSQDEILNIYKKNSYDYFITLSSTEGGVPFSLREAASCELPLIGTKVGGIPEIIYENNNGFLIKDNCKDEELLNILYLAYQRKFSDSYINLRKNSRKIFLEKFEIKRNSLKYIDFLKGL